MYGKYIFKNGLGKISHISWLFCTWHKYTTVIPDAASNEKQEKTKQIKTKNFNTKQRANSVERDKNILFQ